jgi:hypothetical protein
MVMPVRVPVGELFDGASHADLYHPVGVHSGSVLTHRLHFDLHLLTPYEAQGLWASDFVLLQVRCDLGRCSSTHPRVQDDVVVRLDLGCCSCSWCHS